MLPLILAVVGGYLVGDSIKDKAIFAKGGNIDSSIVDELWEGYAEAVLFSETDMDTGEPLDYKYSIYDFDEKTVKETKKMLALFYSKNEEVIDESGLDLNTIGNDIWYTRAGHGAGFFDHNLESDIEHKLIQGAKELGEFPTVDAYNGKLWIIESVKYADGGVMAKGGQLNVDGDDFSYLLKLSDKELSDRLNEIKKLKSGFKSKNTIKGGIKNDLKIFIDIQEKALLMAMDIRGIKYADGGFLDDGGENYRVHYQRVYEDGQLGDTVYTKTIYSTSENGAKKIFLKKYPHYQIDFISKDYADGGVIQQYEYAVVFTNGFADEDINRTVIASNEDEAVTKALQYPITKYGDSDYEIGNVLRLRYAPKMSKGGEVSEAAEVIATSIFSQNEKKGRISTSFGDKNYEGLQAMIENDNYTSEEVAEAIFYPNNKKGKIKTSFGDKSLQGLLDMVRYARKDS